MIPDTTHGINAANAPLFSAAAYDEIGHSESTLGGWVEDTSASQQSADGADRLRVFVDTDPSVQEVVFAFRGMDNWQNARSVITSAGLSEYNSFHSAILDAYFQGMSQYSTYHFFVDGHSLGGEMAQNFAIEAGLDGFGQNSLPVTNSTPDQIQAYLTGGTPHQFIETNVAGDIATLWFSRLGHGEYIDSNPTELPSIYPALEVIGTGSLSFGNALGPAIAGWAFYQAHSVYTAASLSARYSVGADGHLVVSESGTTQPTSGAIWTMESFAQVQNVTENNDGSFSIRDTDGNHYILTATVDNSDTQNVSFSGAKEDYWSNPSTTYYATAGATLTNGDVNNPVYSVSWQANEAQSYQNNSGSYSYASNGSFSGSWVWDSLEGGTEQFSFDSGSGTLLGAGTYGTEGGATGFTYHSDGTFSGQGFDGYVTGTFTMTNGGEAIWNSTIQGGSYTEFETWDAGADGGFKENYSDTLYADDAFVFVLNSDGSYSYA
ncbi:hypothetical protein [Ralstonia solanacearum]|uniref:hypothetical protein n=1 Tax=Ralstonia solanacearum TaxID=305 RepID=UPI000B206A7E|nr:hypothetical protein [Ralstonia solanacearum]MCL9828345.1 hypothetical protein [Ralstonia solanacearum]MCL9833121.1 hypothetical protein [Ralstonia solanacearum]MCL9837902.1 hypothetical protein [Ralstonia solanacearum]